MPCALGRLLVAATDKGLCAVKLGSADAPLVAELVREFPLADVRAGKLPAAWIRSVSQAIDRHPDAPI